MDRFKFRVVMDDGTIHSPCPHSSLGEDKCDCKGFFLNQNSDLVYNNDGLVWARIGHNIKCIEFCTGRLSFYNEPLYDGDIVQSFHFKDVKGKKHYLYHVIEWRDEVSGWYARSKDADAGASGNGSIQLWVYLNNAPNSKVVGNIHEVQ